MGCSSGKNGKAIDAKTVQVAACSADPEKMARWTARVEKEMSDQKLPRVHEAESKLLSLMDGVPFEVRNVMVELDIKPRCSYCKPTSCCGYHPEFYSWPIHTVIVGKEHSAKLPIVLVHGFMMGAACFFKWYPMLAKERTVYAIDIIGMGGSGQPPFKQEHQTPERAEKLLVEPFMNWATVMGLSEFVLLGHSLGGFVASAWAAKDSRRIKHLGLLSPLLGWTDERIQGMKDTGSLTWQRRAIRAMLESAWEHHFTPQTFVRWIPGAEGLFQKNAQKRFGRAKDMSEEEGKLLAEYVVATMATPASAEEAAAVCFEPFCKPVEIDGATIKQRLDRLRIPMFAINGDHDWMEAATPQELPKCYFHTLPDSGHHLYFDNPEGLTNIVMGELSSHAMSDADMDALRELGYEYRGKPARLMQVGKDEGFVFQDQDRYDKLADTVLSYVETLLESEGQLQQLLLPLDAEDGPRCPVYISSGFERADKVLLLIQGGGRVRVGVWGCALCINKDLDQGSMVPYVQRACEAGYGVIVLNPNLNSVDGRPVPGSESCSKHVAYVWQRLVLERCEAGAPVDIVAHSNGGRALLEFLKGCKEASGRIRGVVFTDSFHSKDHVAALSKPALAVLDRAVNYVPHNSAFGTAVEEWTSLGYDFTKADRRCKCFSAAVDDHAAVNQASLEAAFAHLALAGQ